MNKRTIYNKLTSVEQLEFITKLLHCVQNNNVLYDAALEIIDLGELLGTFNNVKIGLQIKTIEKETV